MQTRDKDEGLHNWRLFEGGAYSSNFCNWQLKSLLHLGQIVITFRNLLHLGSFITI